jgi:O-antigen ligase
MTGFKADGARGQIADLPLSARTVVASLVSFEALVVLYMFAGLYKEDPRFAWIPFDPTGLFFAASVIAGALILVMKPIFKRGLYPVFACLLLVVWFRVSLAWTPSRVYGPDKVFAMTTLVLWGLAAGAMIIAPDRTRLRRLFIVLVLAATAAAIAGVSLFLESGGGLLRVGGGNYILLGRLCGLGEVIVFVAWLFARRRFGFFGLTCIGLFGLFICALLIGGGRGPLLATVGALIVPLILGVRPSVRGLRIARYQGPALGFAVVAVGALVVWVQTSDRTPETLRRLEVIIRGDGLGRSAEARLDHYELAPGLWGEAPILGHGAGSWPLITNQGELPHHPHNLFAEVAVEGGLVGLVLLLALFAVALRPVSLARARGDPLAMCALMLFVNAFLNAMVSADIPQNRALFLLLGTLTVFALPQNQAQLQPASFLRRPRAAPPATAGSHRPMLPSARAR